MCNGFSLKLTPKFAEVHGSGSGLSSYSLRKKKTVAKKVHNHRKGKFYNKQAYLSSTVFSDFCKLKLSKINWQKLASNKDF